METWVNIGIYGSYVLIGICVVGILAFSLINILKNPTAAKSALVGLVGVALILGISYAMSTGDDANTLFAAKNVDEGTSRLVGMGLTSFYILAALTILAILYVEVSRLFTGK